MEILSCTSCRSGGYIGFRPCRECGGYAMGAMFGDTFVYYGEPLTRYHIEQRRGRRWLLSFELLGAVIFFFGFFAAFGYAVYRLDAFDILFSAQFWLGPNDQITRYAWLALLSLAYLIYRLLDASVPPALLWCPAPGAASRTITWAEVRKLPRSRRMDLTRMTSVEAKIALERAYHLAQTAKSDMVDTAHLFHALMDIQEIRLIFLRLRVDPKNMQARLAERFHTADIERTPYLASETQTAIFRSMVLACAAGGESIRPVDFLVAAFEQSAIIQDVLADVAVDNEKMANVVAWIRVRERLRRSYRMFRRAAAHRSKYGIDRAMTAVATPYLNAYSQDLTLAAKFGYLSPCLARDAEIDEMFRVIEGGRANVLLVGPPGVGKMSIVEGVAQRMVEERVPKRLQDKRLVQISTSALLAGTTTAGAEERLIGIAREIRHAGNVILFIHNIHDLVSVNQGQSGLDVAGALAEVLSGRDIVVFATATTEGYNRFLVNNELGGAFAKVDVREMDLVQAMQVLEGKIGGIEHKHNVFFTYDALAAAVQMAGRFLRDQYLPESAIELATEAGAAARQKKGENTMVERDDVAGVVAQKTGVPAASVTKDESEKLLQLETIMHDRIVGQDEAVSLVANALRRARAEVRSTKRPIAALLFLGPTGVGKTELAKTIAEAYFGAEDRMVRFDMSEFQDTNSIYRLIGEPGKQGTGLLTEAVRQRPFSLVLLDELEKADANVLNLFLQVFDDGRLTDSVGRVIDFTDTIIIATSNAGTTYVQKEIAAGKAMDEIRQALTHGELTEYYRPEFLNRFDAIVLFKSLAREEIKEIAKRMLNRVAEDLEVKGIALVVEEGALEALADAGFDPTFGARPMRRAIQDRVEDQVAKFILGGSVKRRDTIVLGDGLSLRVEAYKRSL